MALLAPARPVGSAPHGHPLLQSTPKAKPTLGCRPKCRLPTGPKHPSQTPFQHLNPLPLIVDGSISLCSFLGVLPKDFPDRWRRLLVSSEEAEERLSRQLPYHLVQAITASEDRRFFYHSGVDPNGIARAVVNYPTGGGGSTITQQLMKRVFLTSERTISRKFVEGLLSLMVEKRMSKCKIMYSYLRKMYWGHGIYGLESASFFYFGKHYSLLTVGESALLAGILPAPELLSPFANPSRGKTSQTRVLRRMVAAGFLDVETALKIARQPLCLRPQNETSEGMELRTSSSAARAESSCRTK